MFYFARLIRKFKKFFEILRNPTLRQEYRRAQAAVEYFLIFAAVAAIALLGASIFYDKAHTMATDFFTNTARAIMDEPAGGVTPPPLPQCLHLNDLCLNDDYRGTPGGCCLELSCQSGRCFSCLGLNQKCGAGVPLPCCPEVSDCRWDVDHCVENPCCRP